MTRRENSVVGSVAALDYPVALRGVPGDGPVADPEVVQMPGEGSVPNLEPWSVWIRCMAMGGRRRTGLMKGVACFTSTWTDCPGIRRSHRRWGPGR